MIGVAASLLASKPEFVKGRQHFHVEPPAGSPFTTGKTILFSENDGKLGEASDAESTAEAWTDRTEAFLDDILARSKRAAVRYPSSVRVHVNLGMAHLNAGQLDEAAAAFQAARDLKPANFAASANLGRVLVLQGRLDEAEQLCLGLREMLPREPVPLMYLADIATRRERFTDAAALWREVIGLAPRETMPHYFLGMLLLHLGRGHWHEAIGHLREATRRDVRFAPLHHGLGIAYALEGNLSRAARSFKAALALLPGMGESSRGLAWVLLKQGRVNETIDHLRVHLEVDDADHEAREILAEAYAAEGRYADARSELFRALGFIRDVPQPNPLEQARLSNNIGVYYLLQKDWHQAARFFTRSIDLLPDATPVPYLNLARDSLYLGRAADAQNVLKACEHYFPQEQEAQFLFAVAFAEQERYDDAIERLRRSVESGKAAAGAYALLGTILLDNVGNSGEAVEVLLEGRKRFPTDTLLINNLAYAHLMRGEVADARTVLALLAEKKETDFWITATRGLLHLWEGDFQQGAEGYRTAERMAKQAGNAALASQVGQKMHLELARAYRRLGNQRSARREAQAGLAERGRSSYQRDLQLLADELDQEMRAG